MDQASEEIPKMKSQGRNRRWWEGTQSDRRSAEVVVIASSDQLRQAVLMMLFEVVSWTEREWDEYR